MRKALWLGRGIAGMGNIPMLGVKKKVEPVEPEPTEPTEPSVPTTVEPMLVTPAAMDVIISSASDLEIDWGDGTIQTVKSGDDYLYEMFGLVSNQYVHTYTDSYEDKVISIKHLDGKSPIQFLSTIFFKTVERWYSEGYQPFRMFNEQYGIDREMAFYGLGKLLETVPNTPPPNTVHLSGMFSDSDIFNQDISGWDVSSVTGMVGMFYNAKAFNQDLSNWCVTNITSEPQQFAVGSILAAEHKPVWGTCPSGESEPDTDPTTDPIVDPITNLFANNEQGFYYDPNDLSTLYQDSEGTVPVTGVDQPVGLILDKSGRDNHAFQANSASRPVLRKNATTGANYLEFDGVDDGLQTNTIDFTATDKMSLFAGLTKLSDKVQMVVELSANSSASGSFGSFFFTSGPDGIPNGYSSMARGSVGIGKRTYCSTFEAPDNAVITIKHDISGDLSSMRRNGVVGVKDTSDKGTGNFRSYPLFIGRRGGTAFAFTGHVYGLVGVGRLTSEVEITDIENVLANQVGVAL